MVINGHAGAWRRLLLLTLAGAGCVEAAESPPAGTFFQARIGTHRYSDTPLLSSEHDAGSGRGTAWEIGGGYRWGWIGIEAGRANLGSSGTLPSYADFNERFDVQGWTLGANGRFAINDRWHLDARLGLFLWDLELISQGSGYGPGGGVQPITAIFHDDGRGWYAGAGLAYDLTEHFGVSLNFDHYDVQPDYYQFRPSANVTSLGAEYRF